jgi:hypothetical protein
MCRRSSRGETRSAKSAATQRFDDRMHVCNVGPGIRLAAILATHAQTSIDVRHVYKQKVAFSCLLSQTTPVFTKKNFMQSNSQNIHLSKNTDRQTTVNEGAMS